MLTRFTTPCAVPIASGGASGERSIRASTFSPAGRSTKAASGAPPDSAGASFVGTIVGSSSGDNRVTLPDDVTTPNSPRTVVRTAPMIASCFLRDPVSDNGSALVVRASRPVEESSTQHGSSDTSSGVAAVFGAPDASNSTVRRGVPWVLATSASSVETSLCSTFSSPRIASSSSMALRSSSASLSSSMRENLVSWRSWSSRM